MEEVKKTVREIGLENGYLENKKVYIKPNVVDNPMHVGNKKTHPMTFMGEGCVWSFCLPYDLKSRGLANPFNSEEERKYFEGITGRSLNHRDFENNFWWDFRVNFEKTPELMTGRKFLDLSDPDQNLQYRVLRACKEEFADGADDFERNPYRKFTLLPQDETLNKASKEFNEMVDFWMEIGRIKNSKESMIRFLTLFYSMKRTGKIVPEDAETKWYENEVMTCAKTDMVICINIMNDKDKDIRELLADGLLCNAVERKGVAHFSLPGLGEMFTMDDLVKKVNSIKGDPVYLKLEAQVFEYRENKGKRNKPAPKPKTKE